jgi:hypothetical protein
VRLLVAGQVAVQPGGENPRGHNGVPTLV